MEPKFQSSFIPKGPIATSGSVTSRAPKKKSFLGIIALVLFAVAIAGTLGVFGYNFYLKYRVTKMGEDIENARASIQPETIEEITRMDDRINSTEELLKNHSIISPLFEFLEGSTVREVRFTDLDFETTEEGLMLKVQGQARGYSAVALQSEILNDSGHFKNPVFSNLRLDREGNVLFLFSALIDPAFLSYEAAVSSAPVQVQTPPTLPESAATSTPGGAAIPAGTSTPPVSSTTPASVI